ncbi:hypothetical protein ACIQMR_33470 [Streptomyces sp. NPDC091376]|uniref:hypothetical protein n=1 Tax=Streptomyces sp. NPDC091376 TaxID=3365994 RepID=UPI00380A7CF4
MEAQGALELEMPEYLRQDDWIQLYTPEILELLNYRMQAIGGYALLKRHFLAYCAHYLSMQVNEEDRIYPEERNSDTCLDIWHQYLERDREATTLPGELGTFMTEYLQQPDLLHADLDSPREVFPTLLGRTDWYSVDNALTHYQVAFRAAYEEVTAAHGRAMTITTEGPQGGASPGGREEIGKPTPDQQNSPAITGTGLELPVEMSSEAWDNLYSSRSKRKLYDYSIPGDLPSNTSDTELAFIQQLFKRYCHLYATQLGHKENVDLFCERPLHDPHGPQPDIWTIINQTGPTANSQLRAPERIMLIFTYFREKFSERVEVSRRRLRETDDAQTGNASIKKLTQSDRELLSKVLMSDLVFTMAFAALEAGVASAKKWKTRSSTGPREPHRGNSPGAKHTATRSTEPITRSSGRYSRTRW